MMSRSRAHVFDVQHATRLPTTPPRLIQRPDIKRVARPWAEQNFASKRVPLTSSPSLLNVYPVTLLFTFACLSVIATGTEVSAQVQPAKFSSIAVADRIPIACTLFCLAGNKCVIDICGKSKCVPLCDKVECRVLEVCAVRGSSPVCIPNPCILARCPASAPICVAQNGGAKCIQCPVVTHPDPACCKLSDGSLVTEDRSSCGCRRLGTAILRGACPQKCLCPPRSQSNRDVCCTATDGTRSSVPACECTCRGGTF
jgi:hypothetical protein